MKSESCVCYRKGLWTLSNLTFHPLISSPSCHAPHSLNLHHYCTLYFPLVMTVLSHPHNSHWEKELAHPPIPIALIRFGSSSYIIISLNNFREENLNTHTHQTNQRVTHSTLQDTMLPSYSVQQVRLSLNLQLKK